MCGIFGHYHPAGADHALVMRMAQTLAHRGPDGYGTHDFGLLAFGSGRLAIIDLSAPAGPLFNEDNTVGVVFNGEIYNYRLLRAELEKLGHAFSTHTDTEVIVHGYEAWGINVLEHLRGMFGLGIWDVNRRRLLLARDRLGEKPLYYARLDDELIFASEAKALFDHPHLRRAVNSEALPHYLIVGYVPPPMTLFEGIEKLGPGERLVLQDGRMFRETYWQPCLGINTAPPYAEAVRCVRDKLIESVEMQMMSDVPIGTFLSGGVDSTAVAAIMQRASSKPINTFTVGFDLTPGSTDDKKFNVDVRYAREAAASLGTRHHEIYIRPDDSLAVLLPHLVYAHDEPAQTATFVQSAYVAALARIYGVRVLLNGEAADELFLGYNLYRHDRALERYLRLPRLIRDGLLNPIFARLPGTRFDVLRKLAHKSRQGEPAARYLEWARLLRYDQLSELLSDATLARRAPDIVNADLRSQLAQPGARCFTDRIAYANLRRIVAENFNMRVDKMSMAMSAETRAPYEDYELVDLALSLPLEYKLRNGDFKAVLKDAVRDLVPSTVLSRPKWGFNSPQSKWLRGPLRSLTEKMLAPERVAAAGFFDPKAVQRVVHAHIHEGRYEMWAVWSLLVFHLWYALYIDQSVTLEQKLTPAELHTPLSPAIN